MLGIDPGLSRCGYGAVRRAKVAGAPGNQLVAVACGVMRTDPGDAAAQNGSLRWRPTSRR